MAIQVIRDVSRAQRYMLDKLAQGTSLARLIIKKNDFSRGTFRLPMAEAIHQGQPLDFGSGNLSLAKDEEKTFARVVRSFIGRPGSALLMQDTEARMSDPVMERLAYRHLAVEYGEEVYWRVAGVDLAELSDDQMLDVIHSTSYFAWTGFFYSDGISRTIGELDEADVEHVATHLIGVAVGALDYRSFLIWWRDDLCPFPI